MPAPSSSSTPSVWRAARVCSYVRRYGANSFLSALRCSSASIGFIPRTSPSQRTGGRPIRSAACRVVSRRPTSCRISSRGFTPYPRSPCGRARRMTCISAALCSRRGSPTFFGANAVWTRLLSRTAPTPTPTRSGPSTSVSRGSSCCYARRETPRRAVELALAGLKVVVERRPETRVVLFGSGMRSQRPVPMRGHRRSPTVGSRSSLSLGECRRGAVDDESLAR